MDGFYGLEAIANAHGWAMAITGATIVMSGLALLAFIISQFPKAVAMLERWEQEKDRAKTRAAEESKKLEIPERLTPKSILETDELVKSYEPLAGELGESFELSKLYALGREKNLPHVHLSIRTLQEAGKLVSLGEGVFSWNK